MMELSLSENIRAFRKQRSLTQEQLAEVLGVTPGAVYKWEAKLSVPELPVIVKLADFFDTSVDVLLGYKIRNNSLDAIAERLNAYIRNGDPAALSEAEKALKKYPNSFEVVHGCAQIYNVFGAERHDADFLHRALELYEQALLLISQNTGSYVSEYTIYGDIGGIYTLLGEAEKGVDILKKHNTGGMFDDGHENHVQSLRCPVRLCHQALELRDQLLGSVQRPARVSIRAGHRKLGAGDPVRYPEEGSGGLPG